MLAILITTACAGAVPVPDDKPVPIEEIDTTVTDAEVGRISMPAGRHVEVGGALWIALRTNTENHLELVVGHDDEVLAYYDVGQVARATTHATVDGNTFDSRGHVGDYHGPILFAVRVPVGDSTEQLVVFHRDASLRVVHRRLGVTAWTPTLSLTYRRGTTFEPVGSADPH